MALKEIKELYKKPTPPQPATAEVIETEEGEVAIAEFEINDELNTVSFTLSNGKSVTVREPRPLDFTVMDTWMAKQDEDHQSTAFGLIKLVSLSVVNFDGKPKVSYQELCDNIETFEDKGRVVACLRFFPAKVQQYFRVLSARLEASGMQPPKALEDENLVNMLHLL